MTAKKPLLAFTIVVAAAVLANTAYAEFVDYYIAVDTAPYEPTWSAFADPDGDPATPPIELANPNLNRLTLLYAHEEVENLASNHFHTVGRYAYTGDLANPSVTDKNEYSFWSGGTLIQGLPGHFIPEQFGDLGEVVPPLTLLPSDGVYSGKLTTIPGGVAGGTYADMEIRSTADLATYADGTPEHIMLHSLEPFGEKYDASMAGANIAIELLDLTPGLNIGSLSALNILSSPGDTTDIGSGDNNFSFTPVFWTETDAAPGVYSATMRLVDLRTSGEAFLPSGQYTFSFAVVPEPSIFALATAPLAFAVTAFRRRRRHATGSTRA